MNTLNTLLDSIYELEGLVHLAMQRDETPPSLPQLIARKARQVADLAQALPDPGSGTPLPQFEDTESTVHEDNPHARGRLVFSINDRYRFKRELFDGSDADFNTTLALIASMDSFIEAEEYFTGELMWDPARPEVKDFFKTIAQYFD